MQLGSRSVGGLVDRAIRMRTCGRTDARASVSSGKYVRTCCALASWLMTSSASTQSCRLVVAADRGRPVHACRSRTRTVSRSTTRTLVNT